MLCEGLDHFYNSEYRESSAAFDRYISLDPSDPIGPWRKLTAEFFLLKQEKAFPVMKTDEGRYNALSMLAQTTINIAEAAVRAENQADFNRYVEASSMSMLGTLQFYHGSRWQARVTGIASFKLAEQSADQNAEFLLGTINYEISKYPFLEQIITGLPHNREKGRMMIFESALQNRSPFVDDIRFMIFTIETDKGNRTRYEQREIETHWKYLSRKYPRNRLLREFADGKH